MLKRKIKIILIGLSSLLFLGLIYSLFSAKPEIIADASLRIQETEIPAIESQVDRAINANSNQSSTVGDNQIESSLENQLLSQSTANDRDEMVSPSSDASKESPLNNEPSELAEAAEKGDDSKELRADFSTTPVKKPEVGQAEDIERMMAQSVSPFRDDAITQRSEANQKKDEVFLTFEKVNKGQSAEEILGAVAKPKFEQSSDVATIPGPSGFLDLNLSKVKSKQQAMTLGDQLIVDDINKELGKYSSVISETPKSEKIAEGGDRSAAEEELVVQVDLAKPSVFSLPEVDQELMQSNSEDGLQYRKTMAKLISINAKLRDADKENADLQGHFEIVVTQNRQLAQIIRDIDTQIKSFTSTN